MNNTVSLNKVASGTTTREVLHLVLKKRWYEMIASGEKKEEYRAFTPYYIKRLCANPVFDRHGTIIDAKPIGQYTLFQCAKQGIDLKGALQKGDMVFKDYSEVCFHLGYSSVTMSYRIQRISLGTGREEWGAQSGVEYFVIALGERIS